MKGIRCTSWACTTFCYFTFLMFLLRKRKQRRRRRTVSLHTFVLLRTDIYIIMYTQEVNDMKNGDFSLFFWLIMVIYLIWPIMCHFCSVFF